MKRISISACLFLIFIAGAAYARETSVDFSSGTGNDVVYQGGQLVVSPTWSIKQIEGGRGHTLLLDTQGSVYTMGDNTYGQLGTGNNTASSSPVRINLFNVIAIAAGYYHSVALTADGSVYAWGSNASGQLGQGDFTNRNTPTLIATLSGVTHIAANGNLSLYSTSNGSVYGTGDNSSHQLAPGSSNNSSPYVTPTFIIQGAVTGLFALQDAAFVNLSGSVMGAGRESCSHLPIGPYSDTQASLIPITLCYNSTVTKAVGGDGFGLAQCSDGSITTWGKGYFDGTYCYGGNPFEFNYAPVVLPDYYGAQQISAKGYDAIILMPGGRIVTADSSLGPGFRYSNISVCSGDTFNSLNLGSNIATIGGGDDTAFVATSTGSLYACGNNSSGALGLGGKSYSYTVNPPSPSGCDNQVYNISIPFTGLFQSFNATTSNVLTLSITSYRVSPDNVNWYFWDVQGVNNPGFWYLIPANNGAANSADELSALSVQQWSSLLGTFTTLYVQVMYIEPCFAGSQIPGPQITATSIDANHLSAIDTPTLVPPFPATSGYYITSTPIAGVVLSAAATDSGSDVSYLFSSDNKTWYRWSGSSWGATTLAPTATGTSAATLSALNAGQWAALPGLSSKLYIASLLSDTNAHVSTIKLTTATLSAPVITGPTATLLNVTQTYSASATTDYGTLAYSMIEPNGTSTPLNSFSYIFTTPQAYTIQASAYLTQDTTAAKNTTITVTAYDLPTIKNFTCDPTFYVTRTGNCSAKATAPLGTVQYTWSIDDGVITAGSDPSTATIAVAAAGMATVTLTAYIKEFPSATISQTIAVGAMNPAPTINFLNCDSVFYIGASGSCSTSASAPLGTIQYTWSVSRGVVTPQTDTSIASVSESSIGPVIVTVTAYLLESPASASTKTVTVPAMYKAPVIYSLSCDPQFYAGQAGNCSSNVTALAGTIQYNWTVDNGSITPNPLDPSASTVLIGKSGAADITLNACIKEQPTVCATKTVGSTGDFIPPSISSVSCASPLNIGKPGVCTVTATAVKGTLIYQWTTDNGTINSNFGPGKAYLTVNSGSLANITVTVGIKEDPTSTVTQSTQIAVSYLPPAITGFQCTQYTTVGSTATCQASAIAQAGTVQYSWAIDTGTITPGPKGTTATITPAYGTATVTLTASIAELPTASVSKKAQIAVAYLPPIINSLSCDASLYGYQSGGCTASASPQGGGTVKYTWSMTNGKITPGSDPSTASITPGVSSTKAVVTVKAYLQESPGTSVTRTFAISVINNSFKISAVQCAPASVYFGQSVNCAATASVTWGTLQYNWSATGAQESSLNGSSAVFHFTATGGQRVSLQLSIAENSSFTYLRNVAVTVSGVNAPQPVITGPTVAYVSQPVTFTAAATSLSGPVSFSWSINGITSQGAISNATFNTPGTYPVKVTATVAGYNGQAGSSATATLNVVVKSIPAPTVTFQLPAATAIQGSSVTLNATVTAPYGTPVGKWTFPDGTTSTNNPTTYTIGAQDSGTDKFTYTVYLQENPTIQTAVSHSLAVVSYTWPGFVLTPANPTGLTPLLLQFACTPTITTQSHKYLFTWDFGDGSPTISATLPISTTSHQYMKAGVYTVTVHVDDLMGNQTSVTDTITVTDPAPLSIFFKTVQNNATAKAPLTVTFTPVISGGNPLYDIVKIYQWFVNSVQVGSQNQFSYKFTSPGTYSVGLTITTTTGKSATGTTTITVH